jgi:hypothetical protein
MNGGEGFCFGLTFCLAPVVILWLIVRAVRSWWRKPREWQDPLPNWHPRADGRRAAYDATDTEREADESSWLTDADIEMIRGGDDNLSMQDVEDIANQMLWEEEDGGDW